MLTNLKNNITLISLLIDIFILSIIVEIVGLLFTNDRIIFTISLGVGTALAMFMAIHISINIDKALDRQGEDATKFLIANNMIRYLVVVVVFAVVLWTDYLNPLYTFVGVITLKFGAYMVPKTTKIVEKIIKKN